MARGPILPATAKAAYVTPDPIPRHRPFHLLLALVGLVLASCGGIEDKRLRELLAEKGFGSRADGNATFVNYVAGGDGVIFDLNPQLTQVPTAERLFVLARPQQVGIDGTIYVPYVGSVQVLGLTEQQITALVRGLLEPLFAFEVSMNARIIDRGKAFYAFGEVGRRGRHTMTKGDLTVLEVVATLGWTPLANLGRVRVVYPDAQQPLVAVVNLREIVMTGYTTWNLPVYNNTIIYIPPTILGGIARFIERILSPLRAGVGALLGLAQIRTSYEVLQGNQAGGNLFFRF